jgi:hypothetical protein
MNRKGDGEEGDEWMVFTDVDDVNLMVGQGDWTQIGGHHGKATIVGRTV